MSSPLQLLQNCVSAFLRGLMNEKSIPVEIIGKCQMFEYLSRKCELIQLERYCKSLGLFAKDTINDNFKKANEMQQDLFLQDKCRSLESSLAQLSNSDSTTLLDDSSPDSASPCLPRTKNMNPPMIFSQDSSIKDMSLVFPSGTPTHQLNNTQPTQVLYINNQLLHPQMPQIIKTEPNYPQQNPKSAYLPQYQVIQPQAIPVSGNFSPSRMYSSHRAGSHQLNNPNSFTSPQERLNCEDQINNNHRQDKVKQFSVDPKKQAPVSNSNNYVNNHLPNALPYPNPKPGYQANTIKPINFKMTMSNAKDYSTTLGGQVAQDFGCSPQHQLFGSTQNNNNVFTSPFSQQTVNQTISQPSDSKATKPNFYNPSQMLSQIKSTLSEFKEHTSQLESSITPPNQSNPPMQPYINITKSPMKNPYSQNNVMLAGGFKTYTVDPQRKSYQLRKLSIYQQTTFAPVQLQKTQS